MLGRRHTARRGVSHLLKIPCSFHWRPILTRGGERQAFDRGLEDADFEEREFYQLTRRPAPAA
ncbi:hypothetical protein HPA02_31040 [Bisbaumannia pacifica]|uniref:Uncharacterized protein n=1 Tax=Bisbaumannia pacifica TaxID=77098 RepID=A0A510XCN5_9GAMM|nr:hypothetical protein HPA02_31040 [Halomonas pacifica]